MTSAPRSAGRPFGVRATLLMGAALGAFAVMAATPNVALADDECGAAPFGGTVECNTAGNPYPNGVTYIAPLGDLTIVLDDGVVVDTSGGLNIGVLAFGFDVYDMTLQAGGASIYTDADGAFGVLIVSTYGDIYSSTGFVSTTGVDATGVDASTSTGTVEVHAGTIYTTGDGADGIAAYTDSGDISAYGFTIVTDGAGARGIYAQSDGGDIYLGGSTVITNGAGANGVQANATGGDVTIGTGSGSILTYGDGSDAVVADSFFGDISVDLFQVQTTGAGSDGIVATANNGAITIDAVFVATDGDGSRAIVANGDSVTVTSSGFFVATGGDDADAIVVNADNGPATVTVGNAFTNGDRSTVIDVTSTGQATVNGGGITTQGDDSLGIDASGATGVLVNAGSVRTYGLGSTGVYATSSAGDAVVNVSSDVRATQDDAIVVSGGDNATVTTAANSVVSGGTGGVIITSVNGSTVTNAGSISGGTGFAVDAAGGSVAIGNTGLITGRVDLTDGADTFNNAATGRFNTSGTSNFGAGADSFANAGQVNVTASATFTGLETFNNSGLVDLRNGSTATVFTLTGTAFNGGANSILGLDATLAGPGSAADRLVIGAATGQTTIQLNLTPGNALLNPNGTLVVDATSAVASNFVLAGPTDFGFVDAGLRFDAATSNFFLIVSPDAEVFEMGRVQAGAANFWNNSADAWSARMDEMRDSAGGPNPRGEGFEVWAQAFGGSIDQDSDRTVDVFGTPTAFDADYRQEHVGFQMGGDWVSNWGGGMFGYGFTTGFEQSEQAFADNNSADFEGFNVGAYASFMANGFFANGLVKGDFYDVDLNFGTAAFYDTIDGTTWGAKGEVGYRFGTDSFFVEPVAQLSWTTTDLDNLDVPAATFDFDDADSLRGKYGLRAGTSWAGMNGATWQPWIGGYFVQEYEGENRTTFTSGATDFTFDDLADEDYGLVSVGLNVLNWGGLNAFVRADGAFGDDVSGGAVRMGVHWSW